VVTELHDALIASLDSLSEATWGEQALLACLRRLRDGGPTEYAIVEMHSAWPIEDGFKIVYLAPWGPVVGLTAQRDELEYFQGIYQGDGADLIADSFGMEVADFYIAEPLGNYAELLETDADGVGWWGSTHTKLSYRPFGYVYERP
jgi:hypothetical protein